MRKTKKKKRKKWNSVLGWVRVEFQHRLLEAGLVFRGGKRRDCFCVCTVAPRLRRALFAETPEQRRAGDTRTGVRSCLSSLPAGRESLQLHEAMAGMAAPGEGILGTVPALRSPMGAHGRGMRGENRRGDAGARREEGLGLEERDQSWLWGGTWLVRGCPSRSHRTVGRGLPEATQLQRRSDPMSASVSEITSSHSGWAAGDRRKRTEPRSSAERWQCQAGRRMSPCQRCRHGRWHSGTCPGPLCGER